MASYTPSLPRVDFELYPHLQVPPVVSLALARLALQRIPLGPGLLMVVKAAQGKRDATQELVNTEKVPVEDSEDDLCRVAFRWDPARTKKYVKIGCLIFTV